MSLISAKAITISKKLNVSNDNIVKSINSLKV